jgi:hypothetical protein
VSYATYTKDISNGDGFAPTPVLTITASGTHDVSRLLLALLYGTTEQIETGHEAADQLRRKPGGIAALEVVKRDGGPDLTTAPEED